MKKLLSLALALTLLLAALPLTASAAEVVLSPQNLTVDGQSIQCEKYNIDGSNYFKLRDIASLLSGTPAQFAVSWDAEANAIVIAPGFPYESVGGELAVGADKSDTAVPSAQTVWFLDAPVADLSVYNIGGNNFFKLRDLGNLLGFNVDFDAATNTAIILSGAAAPAEPEPPAAKTVEAPKGIAGVKKVGYTVEVEMEAPTSTDNVDYYAITLYDSDHPEDSRLVFTLGTEARRSNAPGAEQDGYFIYFTRDQLNPAYNYNKVDITAFGKNGYGNATWTGDFLLLRTNETRHAQYVVENLEVGTDKRITMTLDTPVSGFFKTRVWLNGVEVESVNYASADNTATIYHVLNAAEEAALANPAVTVKLIGWGVTKCEIVDGVPTVAFTDYGETIAAKA